MWHFHIRKASLSDSSFNDVTFHYSFKYCLTYYIEKLHNASLLIPPFERVRERERESEERKGS